MIEVAINGSVLVSIKHPEAYEHLEPRYVNQCVDVGVDQSKTHSAIVVGPPGRGYSDYIEILGGGGDTDILDVCAVTRKVLRDIFQGATIRVSGVEDPVTKDYYVVGKDGKKTRKNGMDTHENRIKLTCAFANYMFTLYDLSGKHPMRVNNQDWKANVLPEEYRKRTHDKGSFDWHKDRGTVFAHTNDNVTDAACILDFVRMCSKETVAPISITDSELPTASYSYLITDYKADFNYAVYQYNPQLCFEDNLVFVRNRLGSAKASFIILPVEQMPIEEFYKKTCMLHNPDASTVLVLVGGA